MSQCAARVQPFVIPGTRSLLGLLSYWSGRDFRRSSERHDTPLSWCVAHSPPPPPGDFKTLFNLAYCRAECWAIQGLAADRTAIQLMCALWSTHGLEVHGTAISGRGSHADAAGRTHFAGISRASWPGY